MGGSHAHPRNGSKAEMKTARIWPGSRIRQRTPKLCMPHSGLLLSRSRRSASRSTKCCMRSQQALLDQLRHQDPSQWM